MFSIAINVHIWFYTFYLYLKLVAMTPAVLNRSFKINNTTTLFTTYDKISADLTQVLGIFPHTTFENCDSYIECAFLCQSDKTCQFYHYDKSEKKCRILDTSLADIRSDGLYTCPSPFTTYGDATLTFCLKTINSFKTKATATTSCTNIGGRVAVLIEDQKHTQAAALAQAIYSASSKAYITCSEENSSDDQLEISHARSAVWIDATMNTGEKKWYWSDGTRVPESRFNQGTSDFYYKPTSKACVSFIGNRYYLKDCTSVAYVLCDTTGLNKL